MFATEVVDSFIFLSSRAGIGGWELRGKKGKHEQVSFICSCGVVDLILCDLFLDHLFMLMLLSSAKNKKT